MKEGSKASEPARHAHVRLGGRVAKAAIAIVAILATVVVVVPEAVSAAANTWSMRAPIPTTRITFGTTLGHDGRVYVLGGNLANSYESTAWAYDPQTDVWDTTGVPSLPTGRISPAAATGQDGTLYVIGGDDSQSQAPTNRVDAYKPGSSTAWTPVAPLPIPLAGMQAVATPDGHIFVFGGGNNTVSFNLHVYVYDETANSWGLVNDLPAGTGTQHGYAYYNPGAATLGPDQKKIYLVGGYDSFHGTGVVRAMTFDTSILTGPGAFVDLPSMPSGGASMEATTGADGKVYAMGGGIAGVRGLTDVSAYDPVAGTWAAVAPLPSSPAFEGRSAGGAVTGLDGLVYVVGGEGGSGFTNDTMVLGGTVAFAADHTYSTPVNQTLTVPAPGVLANAANTGTANSALLQTGPGHINSFTLNHDGSFTYWPGTNFTGTDTFTYCIAYTQNPYCDSNVATVTISVGQDTTSPAVTLNETANGTSATLTFSATDPDNTPSQLAYACSLDGATPSQCTSPQTEAGLSDGSHTFTVTAQDPAGNTGSASANWQVEIPPTVSITTPPANGTNSTNVSIPFTGSDPDGSASLTFTCQLDSQPAVTPCTSPFTASGLSNSSHTFSVTAVDPGNNVSAPATATWAIDSTPPAVTVNAAPSGASATLTFSAGDPDDPSPPVLACVLDGVQQSQSQCTSPQTVSGLAEGSHTFQVIATDTAGNSGSATASWLAETPPVVSVATPPPSKTNHTSASIAWAATDPDGAASLTYTCVLDGAAVSCPASPYSASGLGNGSHTFSVTAADPGGIASAPATVTWTVDTTAPTVGFVEHPTAMDPYTFATIQYFAGDVDDSYQTLSYTCSLDGSALGSCPDPITLTGLADGPHSFVVTATDPAGHTGSGTVNWEVETSPPTVTFAQQPANLTNSTSATLAWTTADSDSDGGSVAFVCTLDNAPGVACTSPYTVTGLADGAHSFTVTAGDAVGNTGSSVVTWQVYTTPPTAQFTNQFFTLTLQSSIALSWASSDGNGPGIASTQVRYQTARYNSGFGLWTYSAAFAPSVTSKTAALAAGYDFCFEVQATDLAGNLSGWSAPRCTAMPVDDAGLTASGKWHHHTSSLYYQGTYTRSWQHGATLTLSGVQTDVIGVVVTYCPGCGRIAVYSGTTLLGTIDLNHPTTVRQMMIVFSPSSLTTSTITIKVVSSGKRVEIDGLAVSRT